MNNKMTALSLHLFISILLSKDGHGFFPRHLFQSGLAKHQSGVLTCSAGTGGVRACFLGEV